MAPATPPTTGQKAFERLNFAQPRFIFFHRAVVGFFFGFGFLPSSRIESKSRRIAGFTFSFGKSVEGFTVTGAFMSFLSRAS